MNYRRRGTQRMARVRQETADRQVRRAVALARLMGPTHPLSTVAPEQQVSVVKLLLAMGDGPVLTGPSGEPLDGQHRIAADGDR